MFLCDDCHRTCGCFAFAQSRGGCENCRKIAVCVDCHSDALLPEPPPTAPAVPSPSDQGLPQMSQSVPLSRPIVDELRAALAPFALMHREDSDPKEHACVRGVASDMTVITSGDFERAASAFKAGRYEAGDEDVSGDPEPATPLCRCGHDTSPFGAIFVDRTTLTPPPRPFLLT